MFHLQIQHQRALAYRHPLIHKLLTIFPELTPLLKEYVIVTV